MSTFEAFVDMKEYNTPSSATARIYSHRYEVSARSQFEANQTALHKAEVDHPQATEYDVRVTRCLH